MRKKKLFKNTRKWSNIIYFINFMLFDNGAYNIYLKIKIKNRKHSKNKITYFINIINVQI